MEDQHNNRSPISKSQSGQRLARKLFNPFQSCFPGGREQEESSRFTATHETYFHSPPSQATTEVGSVSDSLSSDASECKGENHDGSFPSSVLHKQEDSFVSDASFSSAHGEDDLDFEPKDGFSFLLFRMSYLFVTLVVMLADGLQGMWPPTLLSKDLFHHVL